MRPGTFIKTLHERVRTAVRRSNGENRSHDPARDRIVRRFEAWLDRALAEEDPPRGLPAEILDQAEARERSDRPETDPQRCDLYAMWSAMVALSQEVKLQGRTFKQLHETILPVADRMDSIQPVLEAHDEAIRAAREIADHARTIRAERDQELSRTARDDARREQLDLLLDLRDRLARGRDGARDHLQEMNTTSRPGRLGRWLAGSTSATCELIESARALEKGYTLTLEHLDESLDRLGIRQIACQGENFDPNTMRAVDIEHTSDVPEGTVLEVYRTGYEQHGQVVRPAEVKVARSSEHE